MFTSAAGVNTPIIRGKDLDILESESPHKRVMIVDDEADTINLVKYVLMDAGMDVISASSGQEAITRVSKNSPDVILLDLMMPDKDGWTVYKEIRKMTDVPVIFISALADADYIVKGLNTGADDYICKPFFPSELVARINRLPTKSKPINLGQVYRFPENGLVIDSNTREVAYGGRIIVLPAREFGVLASLARRPGQWVPLAAIAFDVWSDTTAQIQSRIKYLVFLLRSQLERDPRNPRLIISREGLGYKLAVSQNPGNHPERG